jgi:hypothetical protein
MSLEAAGIRFVFGCTIGEGLGRVGDACGEEEERVSERERERESV